MTVTEVQGTSLHQVRKSPLHAVLLRSGDTQANTGEGAMLFKDTDTSDVQPDSQLFVGHELFFLTLQGCPQTKKDLGRLVVQHGEPRCRIASSLQLMS